MIDSLFYSSRGGVKTLLWITKWIAKSFVILYERFERTQYVEIENRKKKKTFFFLSFLQFATP